MTTAFSEHYPCHSCPSGRLIRTFCQTFVSFHLLAIWLKPHGPTHSFISPPTIRGRENGWLELYSKMIRIEVSDMSKATHQNPCFSYDTCGTILNGICTNFAPIPLLPVCLQRTRLLNPVAPVYDPSLDPCCCITEGYNLPTLFCFASSSLKLKGCCR